MMQVKAFELQDDGLITVKLVDLGRELYIFNKEAADLVGIDLGDEVDESQWRD